MENKISLKTITTEEFLKHELRFHRNWTHYLDNFKMEKKFCQQNAVKIMKKPSPPPKKTNRIEVSQDLSTVVDLAMELQHNLFEISSNTISAFQLQLLLIILEAFVAIIFNCYYILSVFYRPSHFRLSPNEAALFLSYQLLQPIMNLLAITITCMKTISATKVTQQIVNKLIFLNKDEKIQARLSQFSMQIQTSTPVFAILGLFNIDGTLLFSIAASTTTYLVILLQYSDK